MNIALGTRTATNVEIYFNKTNNDTFRKVLPQKAKTVEEAIEDYKQTLSPDAKSYGRIILADGVYVGDIWCYCIDFDDTPNAMISYCIFEPAYWNKGIANEAIRLFLLEIQAKYRFQTVGAFTFSDNIPSIKVLEKNSFMMMEELIEDGVPYKYYEVKFNDTK